MNPKPSSPLKSKPLIYSVIGVVLITVLVIIFVPKKAGLSATSYFTASRGDFLISIVEGGNLQAVRETTIRSEVEGTSRVISIVSEGTIVKEGDILVELDSGSAEDQRNQQDIAVRNAELSLINANEQVKIGMSQTNSDITAAKINLELAKIDLKKFVEGELAQSLRTLELNVGTAEADRVLAEQTYRFSTNLFANDFETKSKVDQDSINWLKAEKSYVNSTNALWMFIEFDQKKALTEFESKVEEAEQELHRATFQSTAQMAQYEAERMTKERTLELNKEKLERDIRNVEGCIIKAPTAGIVLYPESRSRFSQESMIEEGATVRYRQELIKLPDTSKMKLTIKVHESHVGNVQPGQLAYVVLDPMPDKRFQGTVSKVAVMPNTADRWSNPNLKVYDTEILLNEQLPESVKPGVSAKAEIVITQLKDVIAVPIQAVTTLKGKSVVYLASAKPLPVPVTVGMYNTKKIEIVSGVKEDDRILLAPPLDSGEGSIDGSIIQDGADIDFTNQVTIAKTTGMPGATPAVPGDSAGTPGRRQQPPNGATQAAGGQSRGGFDREAMTKKYDKDGDGELNEEEKNAMRTEMRAEMNKRLDTNGDGTVSEDERAAAAAQFGGGSTRGSRPEN